jgi:glycosyltransferase involved in cell wall biosynthesis
MSVSDEINPSSPKIAVVVPAYNCEALIEETLLSIAAQSLPASEVWIVNDGSTDGTAQVVERFIEGRQGWHLLSKANGGVSSARNAGVYAAACEWIAFVDSDDLWRTDHLTCLLQASNTTAAEIVVSGVEVFEKDVENILFTFFTESWEIEGFPRNLFSRNNIVPSAVLMKREAFVKLHGFDEEKAIQHAEDWDLWFRALSAGMSFHFTKKSTVLYRRHGANATANLAKVHQTCIHCLEKNLASKPMYQSDLRRTLAKLYRRLGNAYALADRVKASQCYKAAISHSRANPLNYAVLLMHSLHAMALYRKVSELWLNLRLQQQK